MNDSSKNNGNIVIGEGVNVTGNFTVPGTALIEGSFEGSLTADAVVVGVCGQLVGKVKARQADILGVTRQELHVTCKLTVRSSGRIHGSTMYGELEVELGGTLQGAIRPIPLEPLTPQVSPAVLSPATQPTTDLPAISLVSDVAPTV